MIKEPFYDNWYFIENLGEGTFGQVKLAMEESSNILMAVKIIDLSKLVYKKDADREICVLSQVDHPHIIKYHGARREEAFYYLFFEYVEGGELFDFIEPGCPLDDLMCFKFATELLSALVYLHGIGITHRDVKLENVLIDDSCSVKLIDFGLSTVFEHKNKERLLTNRCGSPPYTAPEIMCNTDGYRAKPADLWSFGIIMHIFFTGDIPWSCARARSTSYQRYLKSRKTFFKVSDGEKNILLCGLLNPDADSRFTSQMIYDSDWYRIYSAKWKNRLRFSSHDSELSRAAKEGVLCLSQLQIPSKGAGAEENIFNLRPSLTNGEEVNTLSILNRGFSQPSCTDELFYTQNTPYTPSSKPDSVLGSVSKRMTRFYALNTTPSEVNIALPGILNKYLLSYTIKPDMITINAVDRVRKPLRFSISVIGFRRDENRGDVIITFKRNLGDGLQYRKHYKFLREDIWKRFVCSDDIYRN